MIKSKRLLKQKKISHGFFNKNGGKSKGIYKSLNCGPGSKDKKTNIIKNLNKNKTMNFRRAGKQILQLSQRLLARWR